MDSCLYNSYILLSDSGLFHFIPVAILIFWRGFSTSLCMKMHGTLLLAVWMKDCHFYFYFERKGEREFLVDMKDCYFSSSEREEDGEFLADDLL